MALELNITPEDIEKLVRDSMMKAGFGRVVEKAVADAFSGYNNPVQDAVRRHIGAVATELLREKYSAEVRGAVANVIEKYVTQELIDKTTDQAMRKMVEAAERF